jgi:hypothetical protein
MAIATGDLCPAGRQTLEAHENRLSKLEEHDMRLNDKLDALGKQMNSILVALVVLALTLAANLATRLLGG